ncbi:hypothetical protein CPAR01_14066 [Colletotrichum paranaense]|uniref:Uncharacterized protein n=2 Tax=Colletotrichum acutatum species complex TaxID=2707335 RepID=A0AAI9USH9_9PEZI|nr:uncharacterized protein CPAR01_14066 [Colletotrichum paranaense]KAK1462598.1 hypothetical protein CMEL01_13709 [Colletotrichum melonis]KAK1523213.1 hypothetical protein CPAR01_14066 [Colletotrichum paranaense]
MESSAPTATSPDQPLTPKPHVGCKILAVDTQPCRSREQTCSGSPSSPTNTLSAPAGPRGHTERQERSRDIEMGKEGGNKETVVKERDAADPSPNVHRLGRLTNNNRCTPQVRLANFENMHHTVKNPPFNPPLRFCIAIRNSPRQQSRAWSCHMRPAINSNQNSL